MALADLFRRCPETTESAAAREKASNAVGERNKWVGGYKKKNAKAKGRVVDVPEVQPPNGPIDVDGASFSRGNFNLELLNVSANVIPGPALVSLARAISESKGQEECSMHGVALHMNRMSPTDAGAINGMFEGDPDFTLRLS